MLTAFSFRYARKGNEDEFGSKVLKRGMYFYNILPPIWILIPWRSRLDKTLLWASSFKLRLYLQLQCGIENTKFWNSIWQVILCQLSDFLRDYLWIKITQHYVEILVLSNKWFFFANFEVLSVYEPYLQEPVEWHPSNKNVWEEFTNWEGSKDHPVNQPLCVVVLSGGFQGLK